MKLKLNYISNSHGFLTTEQAFFDPEYLLITNYERKWNRGWVWREVMYGKVRTTLCRSVGRDITH